MFAHEGGEALATSIRAHDVAGVADVRAEAGLIGFEVVGAEDDAIGFGDVCERVGVNP